MLRLGSLCTGYGGLDLAAEHVLGPLEHTWHAEIDPHASQVLAHHWPTTPNLGDLTAVDWTTVPTVDVLTAGFPCQDVSAAGKGAGLKPGTRTGIWSQIAYGISILRPRLVLLENVEGLLSARAHSDVEPCPWCLGDTPPDFVVRALGAVLGDLAALGFDAEWATVSAADVGAPHRRKRVFIAAWPSDCPPDAGGVAGRVGVGAARADGVTLLPTPAAARSGRQRSASPGAAIRPSLDSIGKLLPTPRASDGEKGGPNQRGSSGDLMLPAAVQPERWGAYGAAVARWEHSTGRSAPSPTEPGRNGPRLDPRFVEWLMGLPAGWVTDHLPRNPALKCLGNGVVWQQASHAYTELLAAA